MIPLPSYISQEPYDKQFIEAEKRWKDVKKNGANMEIWTDGQVLNLLRNKMIRLKKFMRKGIEDDDILEKFVIPEKVDFEFDAKKEGRKLAKSRKHRNMGVRTRR